MKFKNIIPGTWCTVEGRHVMKLNPECFMCIDKNLYSCGVDHYGNLHFVSAEEEISNILEKREKVL